MRVAACTTGEGAAAAAGVVGNTVCCACVGGNAVLVTAPGTPPSASIGIPFCISEGSTAVSKPASSELGSPVKPMSSNCSMPCLASRKIPTNRSTPIYRTA